MIARTQHNGRKEFRTSERGGYRTRQTSGFFAPEFPDMAGRATDITLRKGEEVQRLRSRSNLPATNQRRLEPASIGIQRLVQGIDMGKKICGVYTITSPSGKCYVGSSFDVHGRWSGHRADLKKGKHHCSALQNAANKYGVESLKFALALVCSRKEVRFYEQRAIDVMSPEYNSTTNTREPLSDLWQEPEFRKNGIERCREQAKKWRKDPEWRRKQLAGASKAMKRMMNDPVHIAKHIERVSIPNLRKINSSKEIMAKAIKSRNELYANDPVLRERRASLARELIAKHIHNNPDVSEKIKEKNRERMKAMRSDPDAQARNLAAVFERHRHPVLCVETGSAFDSCGLAESWAVGASGRNGNQVSRCARGDRARAFGYSWRYLTKEECREIQGVAA